MTVYRDRREAGLYAPPTAEPEPDDELSAMTKDQLIAEAQALGITPAHAGMSKGDLQAAILAHRG